MGVAGLWDVLKPAAQTRSLTELAITEGFLANPDGKRGFRLGIDASIWFFHAEYGKEGENPVLRTLFFRCATLMHTTFLPIFVFDGPKRPDVKRGKKINRTSHKLIPGMKQIVEAFGFEWRMAPGEAEAELAYLNRIGIIDGVLSDDVDNFLFGATTVIRNSSSTLSGNRAHPTLNSAGKDDKNHTRVFRLEDITNHPQIQLTRGGMILIGLMSGGDYQQGGLSKCGVGTAHGLAKCGFGDSLYEAARALDREDLADFLVSWRQEIRDELRTDSRKIIGRKLVALSKAIPEDFPDIDILLSYVNPITSESMGRENNNLKLTWSKEPNLAKLAETCEFYFEWGYEAAIVKRFRTVIWHSIVLRILRRAVLDSEDNATSARQQQLLLTPKKKKALVECGTPSKMIAKHFSTLGLNTPRKANDSGSDSENDDDTRQRLILKVHSTRTHTSTDGMLEYRLEIAPKQLVELTRSGITGIRVPEGNDEWASEVEFEDEEEGGSKKRGKGQPIDPESHLRVWMPACMVRLVEPALVQEFEDKEEQKKMKKAKKGVRAVAANDKEKAPKEKRPRKTTKKAAPPPSPPQLSDAEYDLFVSPVVEKPNKAKAAHVLMHVVSISSSSEDDNASDSSLPSRLMQKSKTIPATKPSQPPSNISKAVNSVPEKDDFFSSPVISRTGIKDLTKKKPTMDETRDLKSFYPVAQHKLATPKKPQGNLPQSISHYDNITVPDSEPARTKARAHSKEKRIPTEFPMLQFTGVSSTSLNSKGAIPVASSSRLPVVSRSKVLEESAGSSCDEYDSRLWDKETTKNVVEDVVPSSPSKRKVAYMSTSSHSDSNPSTHVKKSPRKNALHTSPQNTRRPSSPTPATRIPPKKTFSDVIELSDSDDPSPLSRISQKVHPLIVARARSKMTSQSTSSTSTLVSAKPSQTAKRRVTPLDNVIDLT